MNKKQLQQPTKEGGLGVIELETKTNSLQARWAKKLLSNSETAPWIDQAKYYLNKYRDRRQGKHT